MSGFTELRYEVADGVATLTLDRPAARNAFTQVMAGELAAAAGRADADDDVRVVLVTGAGRDFCVGADLSSGRTTFDAGRVARPDTGPLGQTIAGVPRDRGADEPSDHAGPGVSRRITGRAKRCAMLFE